MCMVIGEYAGNYRNSNNCIDKRCEMYVYAHFSVLNMS